MPESPWFRIVLLAAVAAYAGWRTTVYFRTRRPAVGIAVSFLVLFCLYELTLQLMSLARAG